MSLKNKAFQIILRVLCVFFLVTSIFLGTIAVVYSLSDKMPNIFGTNVYLVETDAFGFLKSGTALLAKQVNPAEIQSKNVVIFKMENSKPALAQIVSSELYDGVYSFRAVTENSSEITLSQSQIFAKGMSFSDFWGGIIAFAVSPLGMMLIAIVPCFMIIVVELAKYAGRVMPQPEIETVKKQYEVPTYSPDDERQSARGRAAAKGAYKGSVLDESIGLYDSNVRKSTSVERSDYSDISVRQQTPLFTAPAAKSKQQRTSQTQSLPLSQKKLNDAIAAKKAERELVEMNLKRADTVRAIQKTRGAAIAAEKAYEEKIAAAAGTAGIDIGISQTDKTAVMDVPPEKADAKKRGVSTKTSADIKPTFTPPHRPSRPTLKLGQEETVKQYTPSSRSNNTTTSIPRLDNILQDDADSGSSYNIDDILAGLEKRKQ